MNNYQTLVDLLIKEELEGRPRHENILVLGKTPRYMIEMAGFPELDLAIKASTLSKCCFDHGVKTSILKRLPEILDAPKSLWRSASNHDSESVVVLTVELQNNSPIIIPLKRNVRVGRTMVYNLIASAYGKEGEDPDRRWRRDGLLIHEW